MAALLLVTCCCWCHREHFRSSLLILMIVRQRIHEEKKLCIDLFFSTFDGNAGSFWLTPASHCSTFMTILPPCLLNVELHFGLCVLSLKFLLFSQFSFCTSDCSAPCSHLQPLFPGIRHICAAGKLYDWLLFLCLNNVELCVLIPECLLHWTSFEDKPKNDAWHQFVYK